MDEVCNAAGLALFIPDKDGSARLYGQEAAGKPFCSAVRVLGPDGRFCRPAQQAHDLKLVLPSN
jgi:hypothetical protein